MGLLVSDQGRGVGQALVWLGRLAALRASDRPTTLSLLHSLRPLCANSSLARDALRAAGGGPLPPRGVGPAPAAPSRAGERGVCRLCTGFGGLQAGARQFGGILYARPFWFPRARCGQENDGQVKKDSSGCWLSCNLYDFWPGKIEMSSFLI